MYLKRLLLHGFKTFPEQASLNFTSDVSAIIGPNGSGKSNVADAFRWVLGEQSARTMRLRRLEDAIFSGGSRRAPSGFAEVSAVFDNTSRWLPSEFDEVVITRRIHRDGESDYLINGRRVRHRDVSDFLAHAHLGGTGYAILGQGAVDRVLQLRPPERRAMIEEVGDVCRFRAQIDQATERLRGVHDHSERVALVLGELSPRLQGLKKQADAAERHLGLAEGLSEALTKLYVAQWREHNHALTEARAQLFAAQALVSHVREQVLALQEQGAGARTLLATSRQREEGLRGQVHESAEHVRQLQHRLRLDDDRAVHLRRRVNEVERERSALLQERDESAVAVPPSNGIIAQVEVIRTSLVALERTAQESRMRREIERRALVDAEREARRGQIALRDAKDEVTSARQRLERAQQERRALQSRTDARRTALRAYGEQFRERTRMVAEAERRLQQCEEGAEATAELSVRRSAVWRHWQGANDDARARLAHVLRQHSRMIAEHDAERRAADPEELLRSVAPELPYGLRQLQLLRDVITVPASLEIALAAALGDAIRALIVPDDNALRALVHSLADVRAGRLVLISRELTPTPAPVPAPCGSMFGVASQLVTPLPGYEQLVHGVLGQTVIVERHESALDALETGASVAVSVDGMRVERDRGVITVSHPVQGANLFTLQRQVAETIAALSEARAQADTAGREFDRARNELEQARATAERDAVAAEEARRTARRARLALDAERATLAQISADLRALREAANDSAQQLSAREEKLTTALATIEQLRGVGHETGRALEAARVGERRATSAHDRVARELADARARLARLERERDELAAARERARVHRTRIDERIGARARELEALREEAAALDRDKAAVQEELDHAQGVLDANDRELADAEKATRAAAAGRDALEGDLEQARGALAGAEGAANAARVAMERAEGGLASLREQMMADGIDPDQLPYDAEPTSNGKTVTALADEVRGLRSRIRGLGPISAHAIDEFRAAQERHEQFTAQLADVRGVEAEIRSGIDEMERLMRERFQSAYDQIAERFAANFAAFFEGGEARLILTGDDGEGEGGIDILARPPGKRLQNLALLSGGERAMTAIAFLFALLQTNPSPICVLDEVDAALDETNVVRFGNALRALSAQTQFIIITHNRLTMQAAGTLLGVTMDKNGVSRILSLRMEDIPED